MEQEYGDNNVRCLYFECPYTNPVCNVYCYNPEEEYDRAMDRSKTIDSIISLNPVFGREYLNTLTTDTLHELEESILETQY